MSTSRIHRSGAAAIVLGYILFTTAGCSQEGPDSVPHQVKTGAGGTGGGGGVGAGGGGGPDGRAAFEETVAPGLHERCGACHENGGAADFLAPPDAYASITVYKSGLSDRPLIWPVPEESILITYPETASHPVHWAPNLLDLREAALAWLTIEAKTLPPLDEQSKKRIVPFKPLIGGMNTVYLDPLGADFERSSISFFAEEMGSPASILDLWKLEVYPASGKALRLVHPRFFVYPAGSAVGIPDPVDSLSSVDQTFTPQEDPTLSTGEVLLTGWEPGARLAIDFELGKAEIYVLGDGGEIVVPCKHPELFESAVGTLGPTGPRYCAETCHGGAVPEAKAAMNLSGLLEDPPNSDLACASMRARITPGDPGTSQILDVTDPGHLQVIHMYKFNGNTGSYETFKAGMTPWIMSEN